MRSRDDLHDNNRPADLLTMTCFRCMSPIPFRCMLLVAVLSVLGGPAGAQPARVQAERRASPAARQAPGLDRHAPEAGSADSLRTVGLREALRFFRANNLSLRRAQSGVRALEGEARQVKAYPNPTLQATHEPLWRGDTRQSETYLNLNQKLEWSGRQARIASAEKTAAAAQARVSADSARLALQVTEAYVEAATAETRRRRLEQVTRVFRQADSSMAERRAEGDASGYAVRRLRLERARYEQRLAAARLDARSARRQLALLTLPDEAPSVAAEPLPGATPPSISRGEAVRTALRARPELRRWQSAAARSEMRCAAPTPHTRLRTARPNLSEATYFGAPATCSRLHRPATMRERCPSWSSSTRRMPTATPGFDPSSFERTSGVATSGCSVQWGDRSSFRSI